jgi:cold shock CspA family protein
MLNADSALSKMMPAARDMFLHITALQDAGIAPDSLAQGDRFVYETSSTRDGRTKASNVRRV